MATTTNDNGISWEELPSGDLIGYWNNGEDSVVINDLGSFAYPPGQTQPCRRILEEIERVVAIRNVQGTNCYHVYGNWYLRFIGGSAYNSSGKPTSTIAEVALSKNARFQAHLEGDSDRIMDEVYDIYNRLTTTPIVQFFIAAEFGGSVWRGHIIKYMIQLDGVNSKIICMCDQIKYELNDWVKEAIKSSTSQWIWTQSSAVVSGAELGFDPNDHVYKSVKRARHLYEPLMDIEITYGIDLDSNAVFLKEFSGYADILKTAIREEVEYAVKAFYSDIIPSITKTIDSNHMAMSISVEMAPKIAVISIILSPGVCIDTDGKLHRYTYLGKDQFAVSEDPIPSQEESIAVSQFPTISHSHFKSNEYVMAVCLSASINSEAAYIYDEVCKIHSARMLYLANKVQLRPLTMYDGATRREFAAEAAQVVEICSIEKAAGMTRNDLNLAIKIFAPIFHGPLRIRKLTHDARIYGAIHVDPSEFVPDSEIPKKGIDAWKEITDDILVQLLRDNPACVWRLNLPRNWEKQMRDGKIYVVPVALYHGVVLAVLIG